MINPRTYESFEMGDFAVVMGLAEGLPTAQNRRTFTLRDPEYTGRDADGRRQDTYCCGAKCHSSCDGMSILQLVRLYKSDEMTFQEAVLWFTSQVFEKFVEMKRKCTGNPEEATFCVFWWCAERGAIDRLRWLMTLRR